ncbi:MAG: DUF423 domain-containing protein [Magnetococcales bacterium]|nr:DUF423 domain-containing protein [Magnetococcales bacterium]
MNGAPKASGSLFLALGGINGFLAVLLGALGSHALAARLEGHAGHLFDTAQRFHMSHALALVAVGILLLRHPGLRWGVAAGVLLLLGLILFCGSLYLKALLAWPMGLATPFGGALLMAGWLTLAVAGWESRSYS